MREPHAWYQSQKWLEDAIYVMLAEPSYSWFFSLIGAGNLAADMTVQWPKPVPTWNCRQEEQSSGGWGGGVSEVLQRACGGGEGECSAGKAARLQRERVKEGWQPLRCSFLGLPVPEIPFPNINDKKATQRINIMLKVIIWTVMIGTPLLLAWVMGDVRGRKLGRSLFTSNFCIDTIQYISGQIQHSSPKKWNLAIGAR